MYEKNIPEQLIKEVTGHQSDCVDAYTRELQTNLGRLRVRQYRIQSKLRKL